MKLLFLPTNWTLNNPSNKTPVRNIFYIIHRMLCYVTVNLRLEFLSEFLWSHPYSWCFESKLHHSVSLLFDFLLRLISCVVDTDNDGRAVSVPKSPEVIIYWCNDVQCMVTSHYLLSDVQQSDEGNIKSLSTTRSPVVLLECVAVWGRSNTVKIFSVSHVFLTMSPM